MVSRESEESDPGLPASERVMAHARGKAREVAGRSGIPDGGAVLGADTEVVLAGRALGKAANRGEAATMLLSLSGRTHEVMTGVVLITAGGEREALATAQVRMRHLDDRLVEWYLGQGEWQGRAGAYAIQGAGAALVGEITGDPSAVIGLPVPTVADLLSSAGLFP